MANENERNKDNGNFFLGAIFAAVIFFLLFFTTRLRSAVGAFGATDTGTGALAGTAAGGSGASAGGCVKLCDDCATNLPPSPYQAARTPAYVGGGFTEVPAAPIQTPIFNAIGQVVNPYGNT